MNEDLKSNLTSAAIWVRLLYMALFAFFLYIASFVMIAVVIAQFLVCLFSGSDNTKLRAFGSSLSLYVKDILMFLTFNSEEKAFPFADWPEPIASEPSVAEEQAAAEEDVPVLDEYMQDEAPKTETDVEAPPVVHDETPAETETSVSEPDEPTDEVVYAAHSEPETSVEEQSLSSEDGVEVIADAEPEEKTEEDSEAQVASAQAESEDLEPEDKDKETDKAPS